jgi:hypothetical protein
MRSSSPEVVISDTSPKRATIRLRGWPSSLRNDSAKCEIAVGLLAATHRAHLHVHEITYYKRVIPSVNHPFVTTSDF